ncbi:hypothetical protein J8L73_01170 [Pseudoalteromonas sp. MMG006]|uniref:hypothetical protein n=1 Tax=Pseudoalteromonas sp. MMG006 TaxID=2822683 RepID=UPI001B35BAFA|nr:hypothetical protein [Pseudoalteromonas sp. MMG006]MBQ4797761.1 hypothetical protein [Pseudoalteromonas sp. MMG006]
MKKSIYLNEWFVCSLLIFIGFIVGISTNSIMNILLNKFKQDSLANWITSTSTFLIMIGTVALAYLAWNARNSWLTQKSIEMKLELLGNIVNYFVNISEYVSQSNEFGKQHENLKELISRLRLNSGSNDDALKRDIEVQQSFLDKIHSDMEQIVINIEGSKKGIFISLAKLPSDKYQSNSIVSKIIYLKASYAHSDFSSFYYEINNYYEQLQELLFPGEKRLALPAWEEALSSEE